MSDTVYKCPYCGHTTTAPPQTKVYCPACAQFTASGLRVVMTPQPEAKPAEEETHESGA